MSSTAEDSSRSVRTFTGRALFFFAAIGVIASVLAIISFFRPEASGALRVEVTPQYFLVPQRIANVVEHGSDTREMIRDLRRSCAAANNNTNERSQLTESSQQEATELCNGFDNLETISQWLEDNSTGSAILYQYEIVNGGSRAAENILILGEDVRTVQIKRGNFYEPIERNESENYFELSTLNPRESAELVIWTFHTYSLRNNMEYIEAPIVTFSGSRVTTEVYRPVSDGWYNSYDMFRDLPWFIIAFLAVAFSFFVTLIVVAAIALISGIAQGKTAAEIFQTAKPEAD